MKRSIAFLLALLMMISCMAACGQGAETPAEAPAVEATNAPAGDAAEEVKGDWYGNADGTPVTLKIWGGIQPEYGYTEAIANFNKEFADKGIQAEYVRYVNDTDGNLQVDTYLMGGDQIDVLVGYGAANLLNRAENGLIMNMTDALNAAGFDAVKELGSASMSQYWVDGDQIYGLPSIYSNNRWMMINVDMFEAAGIEIPYDGWTYAEFYEAAEKLTYGEGLDKVYGMNWTVKPDINSAIGVISSVLGQNSYYMNMEGTESNFNDAAWVEGMKLISDTMENGYAFSLADEMSENLSVANTFVEGKCAMTLQISQLRLALDTETYPHDFKTALVPGPVPNESYLTDEYKYHSNYSGTNDLVCVASKSKYPEACMQFVTWYITGGMAPLSAFGRCPLWSGFDASAISAVLADKEAFLDLASLENYLSIDKGAALVAPKLNAYNEINDIIKEEIQNVLLEQSSAEEAMASAKTRADALLG